jgi:hypothetical protein
MHIIADALHPVLLEELNKLFQREETGINRI